MAQRRKTKTPGRRGRPVKDPVAGPRPRDKAGNLKVPAGQGAYSSADRHEMLVLKYFEFNFDKQRAAEACGYSKSAQAISYLFRHPRVVALIRKHQEAARKKHELTEEWVISRLMSIADASLGDVLIEMGPEADLLKLTKEQRYALAEYKSEIYVDGKGDNARDVKRVSVKLADKLSALEKLGKRLGLFAEKVQLDASDELVKALQAGRTRISDGG